jgi:hypothetical protein
MSYFLITHPRSGSSNLAVNFCRSMIDKNHKVINLDEFFYPGCRTMWGDFKKYSLNNQGVLLEVDLQLDVDKIQDVDIPSIVSKYICKQVDYQVPDATLWYEKEIENRFNFLQRLNQNSQNYLVKLFVDDLRWFNYDFSNKQCVVLYRKDLLEAILSILIKNYYQTNLTWHRNFRDVYKGDFMIVPDFSFKLDYEYFYYRAVPFFNLLQFIKEHNHIARISYEALFIKNKNRELKIFDRNIVITDVEKKLQYSKEKSKYIENYLDLKEWFSACIKEENLQDICQELDILYEY